LSKIDTGERKERESDRRREIGGKTGDKRVRESGRNALYFKVLEVKDS